MSQPPIKPLEWVASAKKDLLAMPDRVIDVVGYALHLAQKGISTPKHEMDIVEGRLKLAKQHSEGAGS